MKAIYVLFSMVLTIAFTLPMVGGNTHDDTTKTIMKQHAMSGMMGTPTVDAKVEGLHMKAWVMTQKRHKELMKGMMGQMRMHGEEEGTMGQMGKNDSNMGSGKDMKGMKHEGMEMNKAMRDSMMAGTHHIMLDVTDAASGKEIGIAVARVLIVSPSKKGSSVDLRRMMSHFSGPLTLKEKGNYRMTVNVNVGGVSKTTPQFEFAVK